MAKKKNKKKGKKEAAQHSAEHVDVAALAARLENCSMRDISRLSDVLVDVGTGAGGICLSAKTP